MDYLYILREALVWIITIFWLYQMAVSLCSLVKIKDKPMKVKKDHRFMAIIPAHNEETVVGNLGDTYVTLTKFNKEVGDLTKLATTNEETGETVSTNVVDEILAIHEAMKWQDMK